MKGITACAALCLASALCCAAAAAQSVLVPAPAENSLYDRSWQELNSAQRRKLSLYGLRFAPLDPRVWGLRLIDVTESKILIPIRPFFLRASEAPQFTVQSILVEFQFKKTSAAIMERYPREHDPILEIGFAAVYTQPQPGALPEKDHGLAVRLSAFPDIPSGFYERNRDRTSLLQACSLPILETGKDYRAELRFTAKGVELFLDGIACASLSRPRLDQGLISLETSWSPVRFRKVEIRSADAIYSGIMDTSAAGKKSQ
ncbi:MAG: hypothetical protein J0M12_10770 [Deltaproteobacteria bacterium]|nr:hypothetical protein [Deltaproteobacteria bacterium]